MIRFLFCFLILMQGLVANLPKVTNEGDIQKLIQSALTNPSVIKEHAIESFKISIQQIENLDTSHFTYDHVVIPLDEALANLCSASALFEGLTEIHHDIAMKEKMAHSKQNIHDTIHDFFVNGVKIHKILNHIKRESLALNSEQSFFLKRLIDCFTSYGVHLPNEKKDKALSLQKEISQAFLEFSQNIATDSRVVAAHIDELEGLSVDFINSLKRIDDHLYLTLDYPTFRFAMQHCENESIRKNLFVAFTEVGEPHNHQILKRVFRLRDQYAKLMGCQSYAHYEHTMQMLTSPDQTRSFLMFMDEQIQSLLEVDFREISEYLHLPKEEFLPIKVWNLPYLKEKIKQSKYQVDMEKMREFFPLESTLDGFITIFEKFFDIRVVKKTINGLWADGLTLLQVKNPQNQLIGQIVLDMFPRNNKYTHACSINILPREVTSPAFNIVVTNFTKPSASKPSLLSFQEMTTLFHEMGHAMHDILGLTSHKITTGTAELIGYRDFVELPSQLLEYWLEDEQILHDLSCHYKTKEKIPSSLVHNFLQSKNLFLGFDRLTQLFYSQLSLYDFLEGENKDPNEIFYHLADKNSTIIEYPPNIHFQSRFGHLDGYGSLYYGYLFSRSIAEELFKKIKKEGLLSKQAGHRYKELILQKGASQNPWDFIQDYLGEESSFFKPDQRDSLMKRSK